ncbi:MAG: IclR family transcriptional regulator [Pseudomonadota bacterium]
MNRKPRSDRKVYRVQSVDRALDVLDCFDFHDRELPLTKICRKTGLNKSTALRLASNLIARKYLKLDESSGLYSLGMRLFDLGSVVFSSFSLRKAASAHMTQLQHETSATVLLGALMDRQLVYVDKRDGEGAIRISSEIGWRRAPHFGMLGMVLMSSLNDGLVDSLLDEHPLEAHTRASITDRAEFKKRLAQIARDGYVVEYEETVDGIIGVAAPVIDYSRMAVATLGVAILTAQHNQAAVRRVIEAVRRAARGISRELGYIEPQTFDSRA